MMAHPRCACGARHLRQRLCGEAASAVTGQAISVSGGEVM
jgi:hypothetical protein